MLDICFGASECGMLKYALRKSHNGVTYSFCGLEFGKIDEENFIESRKKWIDFAFAICSPKERKKILKEEVARFNEIIDCINKLAIELSGVETLRTDFIANVSHEIKTPLSVIRNYVTLLEDESLDYAKRLEYAGAIKDSTRRLSDMITSILKLNRLENQQIYPKKESYDLSEQLCESLLVYENVWERKGIDIDTDIEDMVSVKADSELLSLVWNNLLSNAFKFTDRGGKVFVSLHANDTYATVVIKDTGVGMSREVGEHIFDKFYQGDISHATEGNGLGLALVKRVIDIVDGEISVESAKGVGTAFTVRIKR